MKRSWLNYLSLLLKWVWRLIEWIWFLSSSFSPSPLNSSWLFHPYHPASNNKSTFFSFSFLASRKTKDRYLWRLCFKCHIIWSAQHLFFFFCERSWWHFRFSVLLFAFYFLTALSSLGMTVLSWNVSYRGFVKAWIWWRYTLLCLDFGVYTYVELCIQMFFFHYLQYSVDIFFFLLLG